MSFVKPFAYYPNTMVNLCCISYSAMNTIIGEVQTYNPDLEVVWGPAELVSEFDVSYSRAFVARSKSTNEYITVIRGTNPTSLLSWIKEDFEVKNRIPINRLAPDVPNDVLISEGAFDGISYLMQLVDNNKYGVGTKLRLLDFLVKEKPTNLYVTGHSLGGTLTPPMLVLLHAVLNKVGALPKFLCPFSFAGLTAGGDAFNTYFNSLLTGLSTPWRFHNSLDVAPLLFEDLQKVKDLYKPYFEPSLIEKGILDWLFMEAGDKYAQPPGNDFQLQGVFVPMLNDFAKQGGQQHHAQPTYQYLVANAYPYSVS